MGYKTIQETSFFNDKREKQGKNWKNRGKITKKQEKTGKNRKLQEIQKHHLDEVPENGNEFSARFREMLKTETETMSSRMSRNDDSRAKTMYRCKPTTTYNIKQKHIFHSMLANCFVMSSSAPDQEELRCWWPGPRLDQSQSSATPHSCTAL